MRIEFLGTGGWYTTETRRTACIMLPELGIVFDAGSGFFRVKERLATPELHVFFSHYHEDHVGGIIGMLDVVRDKKFETLHVYGRAVKREIPKRFDHPWFPLALEAHPFETVFHDWQSPRTGWRVGPAVTSAERFPHTSPGGVLGYVLEYQRKKIVYLTDTTVAESARSFVGGADLFICECNFPNGHDELAQKTGHAWPAIIAKLAKDAGVKKLALTHIAPSYDDPKRLRQEAEEIFGSTVLVAEDGLTLEL